MREWTEADTADERSLFAKNSECEKEVQLLLLLLVTATATVLALLLSELGEFALAIEAVTGRAAASLQVAISPAQLEISARAPKETSQAKTPLEFSGGRSDSRSDKHHSLSFRTAQHSTGKAMVMKGSRIAPTIHQCRRSRSHRHRMLWKGATSLAGHTGNLPDLEGLCGADVRRWLTSDAFLVPDIFCVRMEKRPVREGNRIRRPRARRATDE